MADPQLAADDARSYAGRRHLDDLEPDVVGQRPPVDEDAAELVDAALALERVPREQGRHGTLQGGMVGSRSAPRLLVIKSLYALRRNCNLRDVG